MAPPASTLFTGGRFWLSQNVPQRSLLKEKIIQHGGAVVLNEKDANVKLVDHLKKNIPPDCYSYKYVEMSIRNGRPENPEAHRVGPSAPRPMGASHIPTKGTRSAFSLQDDQILFDWLHPYEKEGNAPVNGNRIYQDLAAKYPQHTWQSWRARYVKMLRGKPRPGGGISVPFVELDRPAAPPKDPARIADRVAASAVPANHSSEAQHVPSDSHANLKRKRESVPRPAASPSKRRAVEEATQNASLASRPPRREGDIPPPLPSDQARPLADISRAPDQGTRATRTPTKTPLDPAETLMFELPFLPPSPEADEGDEEGGQDEPPDVDAWINAHLQKGDVDETQLINALCSTSMDPEIAEKVLEYLTAGKGIPENIPGVWTAEDDRHLEGEAGRDIERVLQKHGSEAVDARWDYLSMARESGLI